MAPLVHYQHYLLHLGLQFSLVPVLRFVVLGDQPLELALDLNLSFQQLLHHALPFEVVRLHLEPPLTIFYWFTFLVVAHKFIRGKHLLAVVA